MARRLVTSVPLFSECFTDSYKWVPSEGCHVVMDALANRSEATDAQKEAHDRYMKRLRDAVDTSEAKLPYE